MPDSVLAIVLGLFGGAGATMLWEGIVKPRRSRAAQIRVLLSEITLNLRELESQAAYAAANSDAIPPRNYFLSTAALDQHAASLSELPLASIDWVFVAHRYFRRLRLIAENYWLLTRETAGSGSSEHSADALKKLSLSYHVTLNNAVRFCQGAVDVLTYTSLPVLSAKRRRLRVAVKLNLAKMDEFLRAPGGNEW